MGSDANKPALKRVRKIGAPVVPSEGKGE
jgi:hypothetical protein